MSEDCCHMLGTLYYPMIVINMQLANRVVDPSLRLACNVPFLIRYLTFYMQVHVIRSLAYDILLGQSFDILAQTIVRNYCNGDQTVTVHDPNTKRVATVPTIPRGPLCILAKKTVFRD
jgi:hypothetical protein